MKRDSVPHTLLVATLLCVVCSVFVAGAAVGLRPRQLANKQLDQKKNVLIVAGILDTDGIVQQGQLKGKAAKSSTINQLFEQRIQKRLIDLKTGEQVNPKIIDGETYDPRAAARNSEWSIFIEPSEDLAKIKRREKFAFVYEILDPEGNLEQIVLPVYGKGLWSTLYGLLALSTDGRTVLGITFYEHGETPGLGAEIENPTWRALWSGKQLFDENGVIELEVVKGKPSPDDPKIKYAVDGISGATITSEGVSNLIRYWLGPDAFGPYVQKLHRQWLGEGANDG